MNISIKELENILKHNFKDKSLLNKALIHKSFSNKVNNEKFEFIFSRNDNDTSDIVFRRIDGKFKYIGNVLAQKSGSYVLWEDKSFYKTTDFAWNLDKVTSTLSPIILSVGLDIEDKSKIPIKMTCNSRSIYY